MNNTARKTKLSAGILVLLVAALAFTGVSQALIAQRAEDDGTPGDISGPCDEAEHANDPRCTGVTVPAARATTSTTPRTPATAGAVDVSGPCDEAEHANDPRCTGAPAADDSSGPSDRSGPGGGSDDDNDDSSGPSDRSGRSHDGADDDSSGHGGSGSDDSGHDD